MTHDKTQLFPPETRGGYSATLLFNEQARCSYAMHMPYTNWRATRCDFGSLRRN